MGVFKKNPIFSVLIIVCLLVFAAGAFLAFAEAGKASKVEKKVNRIHKELKQVERVDPAPSSENVKASEQNVIELSSALTRIRKNLQKGARMTTSTDGVSVMAGIQQFINEVQGRAATHTRVSVATGETVAAPVTIREGCAFGFEKYASESTPPEDVAKIQLLDKQRQILAYVMGKLLDSNPHEIVSVERELVEGTEVKKPGAVVGFEIDPAISARVADAIDTTAFRVTYTGYSRSLRHFLNYLAAFEMPIVVRSIEVSRPKAEKKGNAAKKSAASNLDDIFGSFGGSESAEPEETVTTTPIIEDNVSTFTLTLEFIEVVLPSETSQKQGEADAS